MKFVVYRNPECDRIFTKTPYNKEFVVSAKILRGSWDTVNKVWSFPSHNYSAVIDTIKHSYNIDRSEILEESPIPFRFLSDMGFSVELEKSSSETKPDTEEVGWKKLNNKDLLDLYLSIEAELRARRI